jgi:glycosyltransferase involved in cell wall biosynthesis
MSALPAVTVVMPVMNEERHLAESVQRILDQDYSGPVDVVIAVGPSRDRTMDVASDLAAKHPAVSFVDNPSGRTPAALNRAIAAAHGDVIVRVDGHALIPPDYVRVGVETLERSGADNVGGIMAAEGSTNFERAVARAMTTWFGVGGASFHIGGEEEPALTVYLGCFRRSALDRVGGFDETMERAQDWELNLRIRQTGGIVWFTPNMHVVYRPRHSVRGLARQYHDYGRWRRELARRHPHTLSLRYLAAPLLVVALTLSAIAIVFGALIGNAWVVSLGAAVVIGYLLISVAASIPASPWAVRVRLPLVFWTMHLAWGTGFWRGPGRSGS